MMDSVFKEHWVEPMCRARFGPGHWAHSAQHTSIARTPSLSSYEGACPGETPGASGSRPAFGPKLGRAAARRQNCNFSPSVLPAPTIFASPNSSTCVDEGRGEPGADEPRTGPANLRGGQAGAVTAAQLHSPACAGPARRRRHPAGSVLRAGGSEPPADADRARYRLALPIG